MSKVRNPCVLQDSAQEGVITRDIHRTFPAHDYFKDSDGDGQDSLYKICKVRYDIACQRHPDNVTSIKSALDYRELPHFLYGSMEQKSNLDTHAFMLC